MWAGLLPLVRSIWRNWVPRATFGRNLEAGLSDDATDYITLQHQRDAISLAQSRGRRFDLEQLGGNVSSESNTANLLGMARTALIGGNNEEALVYFNRVLEVEPERSDAWVGKGKAAGWQSTLAHFRLGEALVAFGHAIATAPDGQTAPVTEEVVEESNRIIAALYSLARNHLVEYAALDNTWPTYLGQVSQMLEALETTRKWAPETRTTLDNIVHLCKDNIEGYSFRDPYNSNMPAAHGITPSYEQLLKNQMDQAVSAIREMDPSYAAPAIDKKKADACFVVTATMGDFNDPHVTLLRGFRDAWLLKRSWGRAAVKGYYKIGPLLADVIRDRPALRRLSLIFVVRPAAAFARRRLG